MIGDATGRLKENGFDWKEDEMKLMSGGLRGESRRSLDCWRREGVHDQRGWLLKGHGRTHYEGSWLDDCNEISRTWNLTKTKELLREGNTENTEKWSNLAFCILVKAGVGTKTWGESRNLDLMSARVLDPRNQDRMKRRRAGVVHTHTGIICGRNGVEIKDGGKVLGLEKIHQDSWRYLQENLGQRHLEVCGSIQTKEDETRRASKMKEREKPRLWGPAWGNQMRIHILGDSNWIVNWLNGRWKIN